MKDLLSYIAAVLILLAVVYVATTTPPTTLGYHEAPESMRLEANK